MYIFRFRAVGKNIKVLSDTLESAIATFRKTYPDLVIQSVEAELGEDPVLVDDKQ